MYRFILKGKKWIILKRTLTKQKNTFEVEKVDRHLGRNRNTRHRLDCRACFQIEECSPPTLRYSSGTAFIAAAATSNGGILTSIVDSAVVFPDIYSSTSSSSSSNTALASASNAAATTHQLF